MVALNTEKVPASVSEHRTVSRVMTILEVVVASESAGLRLADLADILGAPKSSIHGLARGLVATGHLREHNGRYYQGPAFSMLALGGQQITAVYHHALEELAAATNETAILATLAGETVINLDKVEPDQMIRASPPLHERRPMWPGSYGKVFVAFMTPRRREAYLRRKHKEPQEQAKILAEVATIQDAHVAYNMGETIPELWGVASPILIGGPEVTLAIGVSGPETRMRDKVDNVASIVVQTATQLSNHSKT